MEIKRVLSVDLFTIQDDVLSVQSAHDPIMTNKIRIINKKNNEFYLSVNKAKKCVESFFFKYSIMELPTQLPERYIKLKFRITQFLNLSDV